MAGERVGVFIRMRKLAAWAAGTLTVALKTTGAGGVTLATRTFTASQVGTNWAIYAVDGTTDLVNTTDLAASVTIELTTTGITSIGSIFQVDWVRPFPQLQKFDGSTLWLSEFGQPEQFDLVKSPLPINFGDGEEIRCVFQQTGNLYILKERSMWVTSDNGQDPSAWNVDLVSPILGTKSIHGVGQAPDFAIIASQDGVYYFDSGKLEKISQEIQPDWDSIDWEYQGHRVWVVVDPRLKQVRIGVPLSTTTGVCSQVFYCDFAEGWGDGSTSGGSGRKWSIDNAKTACGEYAMRDGLTQRATYGGLRTSMNHVPYAFSSSFWIQAGISPSKTPAQADPFGTVLADRWDYTGAGTCRASLTLTNSVATNGYFVASFWAKLTVAGSSVAGYFRDPFGLADVPFTITSTWQRFVATFGPAPDGTKFEKLDLDFGTAAPDIVLFGPQSQAGQFDQGYVAYGGTESGFISSPSTALAGTPGWATADWDGIITPTYEIAPISMDLGRSIFDRLIARIRGAGTLFAYFVKPDGTTTPMNAGAGRALESNPLNDVEMGGVEQGTFMGIRLLVQSITGWFSLKRLGIFTKPHESNTYRGK